MTTLGILGLGAFGQLMVKHGAPYAAISAYDPSPAAAKFAERNNINFAALEQVAQSDIVVIATPIERIREAVIAIRPHLRPGALVMDVASVKMLPARILQEELPDHAEIICTHPLFGPQSARNGIANLKIAVCPIRSNRTEKITAFLGIKLGLDVIVTTPEEHDREIAAVQGLTHMIAKVLVEMEPLPKKLTTVSFDLIMQAVEMVRYDSTDLFLAIERDNPFSAELRRNFFGKAEQLRQYLETTKK